MWDWVNKCCKVYVIDWFVFDEVDFFVFDLFIWFYFNLCRWLKNY